MEEWHKMKEFGMGLFRKKGGGKTASSDGQEVLSLRLTRPENLPKSLQPKDVVSFVRWVNDTDVEEVTAEILTSEPQDSMLSQYELALGIAVIGKDVILRDLTKVREFAAENAAREEEKACAGPGVPYVLSDFLDEGDFVPLEEGGFVSLEEGGFVSVEPRHDHPCGDAGCEECWQVTSKLSEPEYSDFDKPGFVPKGRGDA